MLMLSFAGCVFTLVMGSFLGYHIYLVLCVCLPLFPTPAHLNALSFLSFHFSCPQNTARIKRHSSTYPHFISSDISLPSLPAASQAHPKNTNSPTHSVAPSAPPMRAYVSTTSAGGATPRKYLGHHRQRALAAQNASGLPRGRLGCCGAGTAMVRVRSFRGIPTRRMSSSSSQPSWSG